VEAISLSVLDDEELAASAAIALYSIDPKSGFVCGGSDAGVRSGQL
jgi:hypothetical protein